MYEHHQTSIDNLILYYKDNPHVIAIILGGSIAKECERPDSDVDAIIIVTEEKYRELKQKNNLSECISDHCTYEGGYFDIKYFNKEYLMAVMKNGSEPSRNAFLNAKCLYTKDKEIEDIVSKIGIFQKSEKEEKLFSFYCAFNLNYGYFWPSSKNNLYLKIRSASDIVLFGFRLLLQENEILFPCHKSLLHAVESCPNKPKNIIEKANQFLENLDDTRKEDFVNSILNHLTYTPPSNFPEILTQYVKDNELWWYHKRPVLAEW